MPRFLLLLSYDPEPPAALSARALQGRTERFVAWVAAGIRQGTIRAGARLGERSALVARQGGRTEVLERPAARASFFVIDAPHLAGAIAVAASCPGAEPGTIELYPLDEEAVLLE